MKSIIGDFRKRGKRFYRILRKFCLLLSCWTCVCVAADEVCVSDVLCMPSVREGRIDFSVGFADWTRGEGRRLSLRADVRLAATPDSEPVVAFTSEPFVLNAPRHTFGGVWRDPRLWTPDEPTNLYAVVVSVIEDGCVIEAFRPETFGFREVWVQNHDLLFNGHPLHLRVAKTGMPGMAKISDEKIRATCLKVKESGYNMLFASGNYGYFEKRLPSFERTIRIASEVGLCFAVCPPEPGDYRGLREATNWVCTAEHQCLLESVVRRLQNIPGFILWAGTMNHGIYKGDQNPLLATGRSEDVPTGMPTRVRGVRVKMAEQNARIAALDPTREIYNHAAGAFGRLYTLNCYLDFAPIQERSDWFEHWQRVGTMPMMLVEYGSPHYGSWSNFRGGPDESVHMLGDRTMTKHCWMNEFNAQFLGERAFDTSSAKRQLMDSEERRVKGNRPVFYYDYRDGPGLALRREDDVHEVVASYLRRNLRDFRARGLASTLVWDRDRMDYFTNSPAIPRANATVADDADALPRVSGAAMNAASAPLIGWIAGPTSDFTVVDNVFEAGETVRRSLIILNDTFAPKSVGWIWRAGAAHGEGVVAVAPGGRADVPVVFALPATAQTVTIEATFALADGSWSQHDTFPLTVLPPRTAQAPLRGPVVLYDPQEVSRDVLDAAGIAFVLWKPGAAMDRTSTLVVGRNALKDAPLETLRGLLEVMDTLVVLEQDTATMAALGFRVNEYGLRNVFALSPAFDDALLHDWRGASTLLPAYLTDVDPNVCSNAHWNWNGFVNSRCWRAGNRGNVNSVLVEKPTRGDFRPLVQGGFDLQYASVFEYTHGTKRIVFSQLDVGGRTAVRCPAAERCAACVIETAMRPRAPTSVRLVRRVEGASFLRDELARLGVSCADGGDDVGAAVTAADASSELLVVGPGAKMVCVRDFVAAGGRVLALGLSGAEAEALLPGCGARTCGDKEYPTRNRALSDEPFLAGVSNADLQWRYPSDVVGLARFDEDTVRVVREGWGLLVFAAPMPWTFNPDELAHRVNRRRAQGLVTRLLANLGAPLPNVFAQTPVRLYADEPIADDDPYRYFRW